MKELTPEEAKQFVDKVHETGYRAGWEAMGEAVKESLEGLEVLEVATKEYGRISVFVDHDVLDQIDALIKRSPKGETSTSNSPSSSSDEQEATVKEIVRDGLKAHGYDGLYCYLGGGDYCFCALDNLIHCDGPIDECVAGYKVDCRCGDNCGFHIGPEKPKGESDTLREAMEGDDE